VTTKGLYMDILSSPYFAHGVESEEPFLFTKSNKVHTRTAAGVAEHNLLGLIQELDQRRRLTYEAASPDEADRLEFFRTNNPPAALRDPIEGEGKEYSEESGSLALKTCAQFQITLVTGDIEKNLINKNCNREAFDTITLGCMAIHRVTSGLEKVAKPNGILAMEDSRFMMTINKDQNAQFGSKMDELAIEAGWQSLGTCANVYAGHHLFGKKR